MRRHRNYRAGSQAELVQKGRFCWKARMAPRIGGLGVYLWLKLQTYAASDDNWSAVSCAPPIAGIGLRYCFGCATPSAIVFLIPA